jgi:hypothetical protein
LKGLEAGINGSREQVTELFEQGQKRLETMRSLLSAPGRIEPRADQFSTEAVALTGVITSLAQTSIAPSIRRAADDLSLGFIAPVADGGDANLINRQDQVMASVRTSVAAQSKALATAADEILARAPVAERRFVPLSSAEAVLTYAQDFIPAWAGAISIDLLPGVMVFILAVAHAAIRRQEEKLPYAERITAGELMRALEVQRALSAAGVDLQAAAAAAEEKHRSEDEIGDALSEKAEEATNITTLEARARSRDRLHEDR